jgi:hypothetical protein
MRAWFALGILSELGRGADAAPGGSSRDATSLGPDGHTQRGDGAGKPLTHGERAVSETVHRLKPSADQERKHRQAHPIPGGGTGKNSAYMFRTAEGYRPLRELQEDGAAVTRDRWGERNMAFDGGPMPEGVTAPASGTSIFDPVLCELAYRWFCPEGGAVLDPFAGGSVRGIVAAKLGRRYTGIDLRAEQIAANETQAASICNGTRPAWVCGDSTDLHALAPGQYDFVFSCPPYADLEVYSDDSRDLSTMEYAAFVDAYRAIIGQAVSVLREHRFACFVVGDVRDKRGFYRGFVSDTIAAFQDAGAILYNDAILVTAVGSLPIRVGKQFGAYRKLGKTHQNVLVFYKGDPKRIGEIAAECEFGDLAEDGAVV